MLQISSRPIAHYVIENLKRNGISEFIATIGYLKERITEYFGDGRKMGVSIEYLVEDSPKKTAGSILPKKGQITEAFVVTMGDTISDINIKEMIKEHKRGGAIATMCVVKHKTVIEYGTVKFSGGFVEKFEEKPTIEYYINAGTYIFEPEIFDYIREKEDFAKDVFPRLLKEGKKIRIYAHDGKWQDIGRVADYERLKGEMEK